MDTNDTNFYFIMSNNMKGEAIDVYTITPRTLFSGFTQIGSYVGWLGFAFALLIILNRYLINKKLQKMLNNNRINSSRIGETDNIIELQQFYSYEKLIDFEMRLRSLEMTQSSSTQLTTTTTGEIRFNHTS